MKHALRICSLILLVVIPVHSQWNWLNPLPEGNEFFDAAFISPDSGWVIGGNGAVIRTINGGVSWSSQDNPLRPTPYILLSVVFTSQQSGLASANTGALLRTDDGGVTWRRLNYIGFGIQKLKRAPDGSIWGFGSVGAMARTTDLGMTWTSFQTGITSVVFDVAFPAPGKAVAACGSGRLLFSDDDGASWTQKTLATATDIVSIAFADSQRVFAVQKANYLLRSSDGGATWADTTFFVNALNFVHFADRLTGWLLSNSEGTVLKTENGGVTWSSVNVEPSSRYHFNKVVTDGPDKALLIGDGGGLFRTSDGGATWTQLGDAVTRAHLYSVTGFSSSSAWVFGPGSVYHTSDGGSNWSANLADTLSIHSGIAVSESRIIAGGTHGEAHLSVNQGADWSTQILPSKGRINRFHFIDTSIGWLAGNHGTVAKTADGGGLWTYTDPGVTHDFNAVYARSGMEAWIAGNGGKVYRTVDGGITWEDRSPNTAGNLMAIHFISATRGWVGGQMVLFETSDAGANWTQRNTPGLDVVYDISFRNMYDGFLLLSRAVARSNDGGFSFYRADYPSTGLRDIDVMDDGGIWLAGDFGVALRYDPTPVIFLDPIELDFGDVSTNKTKDLPVSISNTGERPMKISNMAVLGAGFTVINLSADSLEPGEKATAVIRFTPADTGVVHGLMTVISNAGLGDAAAMLRGRGVPPGIPALTHSPDTLDFGEIVLGNIKALEVHISNRSQINLRINDERIVGKDSTMFLVARASSLILLPGDRDSVQVVFAPLRPEPFSAVLLIESNDPAEPQYAIPLHGEALGPKISLYPDTMNYGWVLVDSSKTMFLTVKNEGKADLLTANHRIQGVDASSFTFVPPPGGMLAPGSSVMIPITFTPRSLGPKSAEFYIESTDFMKPSATVLLLGRPTTLGVERIDAAPAGLALHETYPNPVSAASRSGANLRFGTDREGRIKITLADALGRVRRVLLDESLAPGMYSTSVEFDGLETGMYFITLESPGAGAVTRKLVLSN